MNIEEIRDYCLNKKGATESFPFDKTTLVFKVREKIFALLSLSKNKVLNLKCNPEKSLDLRERYNFVKGGYHMNKKHWNSIYLEGDYTAKQIQEWVTESYALVVRKLRDKEQKKL